MAGTGSFILRCASSLSVFRSCTYAHLWLVKTWDEYLAYSITCALNEKKLFLKYLKNSQNVILCLTCIIQSNGCRSNKSVTQCGVHDETYSVKLPCSWMFFLDKRSANVRSHDISSEVVHFKVGCVWSQNPTRGTIN